MARPTKEATWKKEFLIHLASSPYVSKACEAAGISRSTAYKAKKTDEEFSDAWDDALEHGLDNMEFDLYQIGVGKMKGQYGALIYLLKARRYEKRQGVDIPSKLTLEWGPMSDGDLPASTSAQLGSDVSHSVDAE